MGMIVKQNLSQLGRGGVCRDRANIPAMGNHLKHLRIQSGLTIEEAASQMGMSYGGYLKLERGERRLKQDQIHRAAQVYQVPEATVIAQQISVPLVGSVSRNGELLANVVHNTSIELVPAPEGATSNTVAYVIDGGHRLPGIAEEGWYIYHEEMVSDFPDNWIGKVCVCELEDGSKFVCRVHYGKVSGTFDLVGFGSGQIRNAKIKSSSIVTWTKQR